MKLFSFRIQNYKSIKDSGICYVENKLTIFAGKNGSGKSNVLEALSKFSNNDFDFEEDNYNYDKQKPIITTVYKLEKNEIEEIEKSFNIKVKEDVTVILDTEDNEEYEYQIDYSSNLDVLNEKNKKIIDKVAKEFETDKLKIGSTVKEVVADCETDKQKSIIETLNKYSFINIEKIVDNVDNYILNKMPEFVYQKTVENELKSVISLESIKKNDFHKDLAKLMNFTPEDFKADKDKSWRTRRGHNLSQELTGNFGTFYSQDKIDLKFSLDGNEIVMDVIEPEKASSQENKIENKSDGLKWFIAFYTKLSVTKNSNVIILLDEPGMYLHAKACEEMLRIFDVISEESQIMLATHNPYLIDAKKLGNVRLVLNEKDNSTIIENKPHKYKQDVNMDALTPILTSIGYELTMSIHVGNQKNNLITEGISDYYFLHGMANLLGKKLNYLIIPSSSADKINYIASILIGWGLNTIALVDSDKKGKEKLKELTPLVDKCFLISEEPDKSIEDLFTKEEYCKKILDLDKVYESSNSKTKKDQKVDEVLKAKQFLNRTEEGNISISKETKEKFREIFEKIEEEFKNIKK